LCSGRENNGNQQQPKQTPAQRMRQRQAHAAAFGIK
jgi:hypothetical protein